MEGTIEDLPDDVIEDLARKAIERTGDDSDNIENNIDEELKDIDDSPSPPVVEEAPPKKQQKPKRQRSEKQKAAFEKARQKRAENLKIKKQLEAEKKEKQKKEKADIKEQVKQRIEEQKAPAPVSNVRFQDEEPRYREQVVNNYYYYGQAPPCMDPRYPTYLEAEQPAPVLKTRGRKKKPPPPPEPEPETESESEEEEVIYYGEAEEPQSYKELQNYTEEIERVDTRAQRNPQLKFRFA